jgi:hypothetical protein
MSIRQLTQLIPPPPQPIHVGSPSAWHDVETRLGFDLPADYKELMQTYGAGSFDLRIAYYSPFDPEAKLNLLNVYSNWQETLQSPPFDNPKGGETALPDDGLIPLGYTSRVGDGVYWHRNGTPDQWPVVLWNMAYGIFVEYPLSCSAFLVAVLNKSLTFPTVSDGDPIDYYRENGHLTFHQT